MSGGIAHGMGTSPFPSEHRHISDCLKYRLEKHLSTRGPVRTPSGRNSPWSGPIVHSDGITYRSPQKYEASDESDSSSDEEGWKDAPVIPMKPFLTMLGHIPPDPYPVAESPVVPIQVQYMLAAGHTAPSTPYNGQVSYPSPQQTYPLSPPYVPSWASQSHQIHTPQAAIPHWANPAMGYSSPYSPGYLPSF